MAEAWPTRAAGRARLTLAAAAKLADRGEVNVEVVRGGAERVADSSAALVGNVLDAETHVSRKLAATRSAKRVPPGLVEVAARALFLAGEVGQLFRGELHRKLF